MDRWHNCKSSNYIILKRQHKYKSSWSEIWKWILRYDTKSASKQRKNSNYIQFRSGQSFNRARLFATPQTAAHQASLFFTNSESLLKLMSIESVMPSNRLILCCPVFHPSSIFPSIRVFSNESGLRIRWPKNWSFSLNISPSNEYSGLISFKMDWVDLLAVQGTLKSLLQHHSSKASILRRSAFFTVHTWLLEKP